MDQASNRPRRLALLTCREMPEPDPDEAVTVDGFAKAGYDVTLLAWDAPVAAAASFDACIIRSPWNYIWHVPAFIRYLEMAASATRLLNPLQVVRWNVHKRYLEALAAAGIAIVPTAWFAQGCATSSESIRGLGWGEVVIKPCISAGSFETQRFAPDDTGAAAAFLGRLVARCDVMVQPYIHRVERGGERALVWIDGHVTHAVTKQPRFAADEERVSSAQVPSAEEHAFALRTIAALPPAIRQGLLYARIDVFYDDDGGLLLSELELIEPSLFLTQHPPALAALVAATGRRLA